MNITNKPKTATVFFTVKGQIVVPLWLRKEFEIKEGTRAIVYQEGDKIVIKPMTAKHYSALRGTLKGRGGIKALRTERQQEKGK